MSDSASLASNNIPVDENTVERTRSDATVSQEQSSTPSFVMSAPQALVSIAYLAPPPTKSAHAGAPFSGPASSDQRVASPDAAAAAAPAAAEEVAAPAAAVAAQAAEEVAAQAAEKCKTCGKKHDGECWGTCAVCNEVHPPLWQTVPVCSTCKKHHPKDEACPARNAKQCFMCASSVHDSKSCQLKLEAIETKHAAARAKAAENSKKSAEKLEKAQKAQKAAELAQAIAAQKVAGADAFAKQQELMGTTFAATNAAKLAAAAAREKAGADFKRAKEIRDEANDKFHTLSGICKLCGKVCKDQADCAAQKAARDAKKTAAPSKFSASASQPGAQKKKSGVDDKAGI